MTPNDNEAREAEELFRALVEAQRDTGEGNAGVTVPAPQKPIPAAPAVALPEPTEGDTE